MNCPKCNDKNSRLYKAYFDQYKVCYRFQEFCNNLCAYRDNNPKEYLEPCLNCPVEHWLDLKGKEIQVTVTWGRDAVW